jgi:ABC-type multidrug transport system fused ATPase/permease subunit
MQILKFLGATVLVQIATVTIVLLFPTDFSMLGISRLIIPLLIIALMASFWFATLSNFFHKDAEDKIKIAFEKEKMRINSAFAKEKDKIKSEFASEKDKIKSEFASEKEKIKVDAEKEKIKVIKEAQQNITLESTKTHAKANFKVGASVAGVIAVGGLFVFTQMITMGLLALTTAGGALGGYYYKGRRLETQRRKELEVIDAKIIEHKI